MVKAARREMGLTQAQLAERLRVRPLAVSRWERGERRPSWHVRYILKELYDRHREGARARPGGGGVPPG